MYSPTLERFLQPEPSGGNPYVDGLNLYEAFDDNPINLVDPTGDAATAPATQPVKGNKYGDWLISPQTNTNLKFNAAGAVAAKGIASIAITFKPTKECAADPIAYLQIDRQTDFDKDPKGKVNMDSSIRITAAGWSIDRLPDAVSGWYGYNNASEPMKDSIQLGSGTQASVSDAILYDAADAKQASYQVDFIAFAVAYKTHVILAGITWGFKVDDKGVVTSLPNQYIDPNKTDIMNAIKQWNDQADGKLLSMNAVGQQKLGDFTVAQGT